MIKLQAHHILLISMMVFIVLNLIENVLHYNIGFNSIGRDFELKNPSMTDWIKIVIVMILFAYLQGFFTEFFTQYT
jgi:hypothetical protein